MVKSFPQPVQLVSEEQGVYRVCEEGAQFLERLDEDLTLGVVAVAGRYRSGKSFLLNRGLLEAPAKKGFVTGNSINACTRGIWILPSIQEGLEKRCFLVLDTEGTASMEARAEHDASLVGISLALASVFIFNSTGAIDEASLSDLATLTTVAQGISSQSEAFTPPELVWALRDFSLELRGDGGEELQPDEYLERALSEERYGKAAVRAALKGFFTRRRLVPLVRPCLEETQLQKLNTLTSSALRPQFLAQLEAFRRLVRQAASRPKELGGLPLNGQAIARLAREAVEATNRGTAPPVQTIFDFLQERRLREAREEALEGLRRQAGELKARLPLSALPALEPQPLPAFLRLLPEESRLRFSEEQQREAERLRTELEAANREAAGAWLAAQLEGAATEPFVFSEALERAAERLPAALLPEAAARLHEAATQRLSARLRAREERLSELQGEAARARQQAQQEEAAAAELRGELEEALLLGATSHDGGSEARLRELEATLEEAQAEARAALGELARDRDELRRESRALAAELASQERAASSELSQARGRSEQLSARLQESLEERKEAERSLACRSRSEEESLRGSLEELRLEFTAIVRRCERRAAEEAAQRAEAEAEARACERAMQEASERAQREQRRLDEEREAFLREQEEQRRKQTQELLQRKQLMNEAYSSIAQDSQRCREAAASSDRKLLLLEVERESLKRRVDVLELESEELRKLRRQHEEVRYKQASTEASLQASERMLEMRRAQVLTAEEELQKLRAASQARDFDLLKRTAMLELQLQACGVDAR
jgi:Guanylate-binding protein, N-terminal domain